jgi:hypothetical protein
MGTYSVVWTLDADCPRCIVAGLQVFANIYMMQILWHSTCVVLNFKKYSLKPQLLRLEHCQLNTSSSTWQPANREQKTQKPTGKKRSAAAFRAKIRLDSIRATGS